MKKDSYDVVIIGSGAGGGPLAMTLAEVGWSVLVLEKGPRHSRERYVHDEIEVSRRNFFGPDPREDPHLLVTEEQPQPERTRLGWTACCVGGGTAHMGGFLYRFHPDDFRLRQRLGTYEEIVDWPYSYEELEPYYSQAERVVGVSGVAGSNPFEGPRSAPYPLPPLRSHPVTPLLDEACRSCDTHPFATPRAVASRAHAGRPACLYCQFCAGFGCPVGARGSTQETVLARAERTGRCEIRPHAMTREVTVDENGRATGCLYLDREGREHAVRARVVCVCCSAVESARLLLLSRSKLFPNGLANGNGLVGRHLQFHAVSSAEGRFAYRLHPEKPLADPHPFLERTIMDHYFLPEGVADLPKGGLLRFGIPQPQPLAVASSIAHQNGRLVWGEPLLRELREIFHDHRILEFEVFHDYIPNAGTYMELDPEVCDRWGLPAARIHLARDPHHERAGRWLVEKGLEIFDAMGADSTRVTEVGGTSPFLVHGTCRAGEDPATSVLDPWCRTHEVPNLFVVDGAFMPTSGGAAPTLTILANSFRTAEHIRALGRQGEL